MSARATSAAALPLTATQLALVDDLAAELDGEGLVWLSGYAAGIARGRVQPAMQPRARALDAQAQPAAPATAPLTIVYGSQTGNARRVAEQLAASAEGAGLPVRLLRADAYPLRELKSERHLYIVISTQGDGDPPDDARDLFGHLTGRKAPRLEQLHYAVLGLGDSSYPKFCAVGEVLDARLAELGATRLLPRGDADLDIETVSAPWSEQALARAKETLKPSAKVTPLRPETPTATAATPSRAQPFHAELLTNQRITAPGSAKDVRHIELALEGSALAYEPGDALGIWPRNPEPLVDAVLAISALDGDAAVTHAGDTLPLRQWLLEKRELTRLSRPFVAAHAARARDDELQRVLAPENASQLQRLLADRQVVDLLQGHRAAWTGEELVAALRPLAPRLYSIASSRKEVGDEAHLTVAHVEYDAGGETRWGAASHFLAGRSEGEHVPVYVEANERFRLPADASRDVVMIGPGTGVAPFRAFMQERRATRPMTADSSGRNWLFFGNPHFRSDFLYQLEWQRALKQGTLARIDLAFSRDGTHKRYVQHRIAEHARELYDWLQQGAYLYVCGGIAMGKDVHAALLDAVAAHNGGDREAAGDYLDGLARQGRYARDVY
jgi:sulfite reductase (NADPH) flavoprotein alpha-component